MNYDPADLGEVMDDLEGVDLVSDMLVVPALTIRLNRPRAEGDTSS